MAAAAAAGVAYTEPFLVRFDSFINDYKERVQPKFVINLCITYPDEYNNFNVETKYIIQIFKYNINSSSRNICPDLMNDYHSEGGRGKGCSYIGFFDNNISEYEYLFFNRIEKTTWFLDYSVIQPGIPVGEITETNYRVQPPMNKDLPNQVKKVLWAEGISYIHRGRTRLDDESFERRVVDATILNGEHIVVGNVPNAIFTLEPYIYPNNTAFNLDLRNPETKLLPEHIFSLHRKVVLAFLNRNNSFTHNLTITKEYKFFVENIKYVSETGEIIYIPFNNLTDNIHSTIHNLLTHLQNNTDKTYVREFSGIGAYNNYTDEMLTATRASRAARKAVFEAEKQRNATKSEIKSNLDSMEKKHEYADKLSRESLAIIKKATTQNNKEYFNSLHRSVLRSRKINDEANENRRVVDMLATKILNDSKYSIKNKKIVDDLKKKIFTLTERTNQRTAQIEAINPIAVSRITDTLEREAREESARKLAEQRAPPKFVNSPLLMSMLSEQPYRSSRPAASARPQLPAASARPQPAAASVALELTRPPSVASSLTRTRTPPTPPTPLPMLPPPEQLMTEQSPPRLRRLVRKYESDDEDQSEYTDENNDAKRTKQNQLKYLKYKQKYLELKRKLNLI